MEDLEDSVASLPAAQQEEEVAQLPRKLGRLRKAKEAAENAEPNRPAAPASPLHLAEIEKDDPEGFSSDLEPTSPAQEQQGDDEQEATEEEAAPSASRKDEDYFDEEDKLEEQYVRRTQAAPPTSAAAWKDEEGGSSRGDSEPEMSGASGGSGSPCGSPGTMELLAADTQRILRETAARDRLGKGHKIEIQSLSSILDRIKQRQALAIARAPKPCLPDVGSFEDILEQARQHTAAPPVGNQGLGEQLGSASAGEQPIAGASTAVSGVERVAGDADGLDGDGDDLLIMSSDDEDLQDGGNVRLVELPSTAKKARRMPFIRTQEDSYEDVLIDDGYESEEELEGQEEDLQAGGSSTGSSGSDSEGDDEVGSGEAEGGEDRGGSQSPVGSLDDAVEAGKSREGKAVDGPPGESVPASASQQAVASVDGGSQRQAGVSPPAEGSQGGDTQMEEAAEPCGSGGVPDALVPKRENKLQRMFLDMEAELSDEEGGVGGSDDEDEDLDDQGELAGLIGHAKETAKDGKLRQMLHRQWAEQQDGKELQQLMRGLKNGFRRRGGAGFLDDEEDDLAGRRRRARGNGEEEDGGEGVEGALPWTSPFAGIAGSDDEGEDEELLRKAQRGQLLAESQGGEEFDGQGMHAQGSGLLGGGGFSGSIPLDEGSQEVLDLLARSCASEPQLGGNMGGSGAMQRSRFAPPGAPGPLPALGSDPSNSRLPGGAAASSLSRGPSFVGRQPTVQRVASSTGLGLGGRSFIFGRDDSNSALPTDKGGKAGEEGSSEEAAGPTSFANLRQMAGMLPQGGPQKKRAGTNLVSRLKAPAHRTGKEPVGSLLAEGVSANAAAAAVALLAGSAK